MRNKIKSIILFALISIMSVSIFSACSRSSEDNTEIPDDNTLNNGIQHYEIELTKDNFEEFLEYNFKIVYVSTVTYEKDAFCEIKGALNYAYYKDVTVSFSVEYTDTGSQNIYKDNFTVKLNAAGNCSFYTKEKAKLSAVQNVSSLTPKQQSIMLTGISGVVIFDI